MTRVKELYLAKTLDDLKTISIIPDVSTKKMQMLLETARKLFREAEKYYVERDEELAYVFYMKYFNMLHYIHEKPDYLQHKQAVRQMLGGNATNKLTMDKLELLSKSLTARYGTEIERKPKSPRGSLGYDDLNASEKFDHVKSNTVFSSSKDDFTHLSPHLISCEDLYVQMQQSCVLIMDCRSSTDFANSHLVYKWAFNVPEEQISAGMSAGKLQEKLDNSSKALWSARSVKDQIVLMDWSCSSASPPKNAPVAILMEILRFWDPDITYRSPIKILEGGFNYFILMYPTLCTNPSVQAPQKNDTNIDLIDDIEYPSIHDITMKDEIRERGFLVSPTSSISETPSALQVVRPSIDRVSKLVAVKTYDEKQNAIVKIRKELEDLLEKEQANDEQLQVASMKWNNIFEHMQGKNRQILNSSEQELLYHLMQLESAEEDYKIENHRLQDELEKIKRLVKDQDDKLTYNEKLNLEDAIKKIEAKIHERNKLDEQHEREKKNREKQLATARENKRHLKSSVAEEEDSPKPKVPQFDRSVKPQLLDAQPGSSTVPTHDRRRDFSPVVGAMGRGLTGLKNLGNTCYMNSIMQCLSNTPQLTEYCITDKYKNYISRINKTKGHIVEEVAALIKVLWNGDYKCVASKDLRYVIGQYQQIFRGIEQQDSHEFLTILMDWLHSDLQTLHVPDKMHDNISPSEKAWLEFTKSKESLILHLFYGQIKSTVKCTYCYKESATYECFSNLSLELPSNAKLCYLSQCMDMYFSGEHIHGWNCPNCKQKRDAVKKLDISKLPPVMVIHLKRFYADSNGIGSSYKKKQNYVRIPLENLDMTPYIAKSELRSVTPKTYQLYGVSNHYGSMESGHYTAFCKSGINGRWYKFDDQVITPLDTSNVESSAAYILFYTWLPPVQLTDSN